MQGLFLLKFEKNLKKKIFYFLILLIVGPQKTKLQKCKSQNK